MIVEGKIYPYKKIIKKLFEVAGTVLEEDFSHISVSVNFVTADEIEELNEKFRQIKKVTDVLSFPNLDKKPNQKLSDFESEGVDGDLFIGDVVICRDVARKQAEEYGHSEKREICFLALHGLLHLLGFDHIEPEDEKVMMSTAEKILQKFGVTR